MRAVVAEDGVGRRAEVGFERDLVAHCAGHDEEGGFVTSQAGDVGFEGVGGGVFHGHVVEEGGVDEGVEHGGCGGGGCVGAEVACCWAGLLPGVDFLVVCVAILEVCVHGVARCCGHFGGR